MSRTIRTLLSFFVVFALAQAVLPVSGKAAAVAQSPANVAGAPSSPDTTVTVYAENLASGWDNWSYGSSVTLQDPAYHHAGSYSVSCAVQDFGALFFGTDGFDTTGTDDLVFWINGGAASGQSLDVNLVDANGNFLDPQPLDNYVAGGVAANTWKKATIPLMDLQAANSVITGIVIADNLGASQPRFYVDDMVFATDPNATPTFTPTRTPTNTATWTGTPPTATRTSTALPTNTPASGLPPIPSGMPTHFSYGLFNGDLSDMHSGVPYDFRYQYLAGGVNTGDGWRSWQSDGQYAADYVADARNAGYIPGFIYYNILQSAPHYEEFPNLQDAGSMRDYYEDFKILMQQMNDGQPAFVNVEPDLDGVMMQDGSNTNDNAALQPAKVGGSGMPELAGMADNFRNYWQALAHLRDLYAPNVVLGQDLSIWGADYDLTIALRNDPNYDWQGHADRTATYHNSFGPGYGLNFFSPLDRDAAFYQIQYGSDRWWHDSAQQPNFDTIAAWLGRIDTATDKRALMWQVPNGNQSYRSENNTDGHYQDNRPEYFLNATTGRQHMSLWANYGVIGLMFGAGAGGQSHYFDSKGDGITNPAPINGNNLTATVADDDGGYIRLNVTSYYSTGPMTLPGVGGPTPTTGPTYTPTRTWTPAPPTNTRTATRTFTPAPPTNTPTITLTPPPGSTATHTPSATPTTLGNQTPTPRPSRTPVPSNTPVASGTPVASSTPAASSTPVPSGTSAPSNTPAAPTDTPAASPTAIACSRGDFIDVPPDNYLYVPIMNLACRGVISGYSDNTFRPNVETTRGQLSKIVVLAEGWTIDTTDGPHFNDVPEGSTFYDYIETAYNHIIISGYADGTFRPNARITRSQLSKVVVLARNWAIDTTGGPHFTDVPDSNPFFTYVETGYNHAIISGYADGSFRPYNSATRGQIAKIVFNAVSQP